MVMFKKSVNIRLNHLTKSLKRLFILIPIITFFIINMIFCIPADASQDQLDFEHITSADGLSHDTVYSIVQDKTGYIWFGTEDGLNKYDGYKIKEYRGGYGENSIGNANCAVLFVDDDNSIWIASWGGGLEVLNQESETVRYYKNDPADPDSISDNSVHCIFKDSSETMWFGTYTKGLNRFDSKTGKFKSYLHNDDNSNSISDNRVWWISEDADGSLLLGTNKGLDKFDPKTETFTHYSQIKNRVRTIFWDKKGDLWLGTQKGLCKFDPTSGKLEYYLNDMGNSLADVITSIFEDSNGSLWVGTSDGINVFDRNTGIFTRYIQSPDNTTSISNNDIRVIFEDLSANLWIGTRGGGINKINIKPKKFYHFDNMQNPEITLSNINVTSVFQSSDGVLWIGTNNGGLNKFDLNKHTQEYLLTDIKKDENRDIIGICEDENSLWAGSLGGLNRIDNITGKIVTYKNNPKDKDTLSNNTVLSILRDSKDTIWIGTLGGLNRYDSVNDRFTRYLYDSENKSSISSDAVNCLYEDSLSNFWVGTQNGLNQLDQESGRFTHYIYDKDNAQGISDNIIHCITEDSNQDLWIGTQYGLNCFNRETGHFTVYTIEDGLPNNCIHGIQEDSAGRLWISTNKGISCYDLQKKKFANYDVLDGLQGNAYNNNTYETLKDGVILFGGTKGLDFIDSNNVEKNTFTPPIVITSFRVMGSEFDYLDSAKENGKVSLSYKQKNIQVEFSSLDFTISKRNQYAYMLQGFDSDWIYADTQNSLNYTNIPIGNYTLRIKGSNSDGIWNEDGVSLEISISPPWWLTTYAYIIYTIFALFLVCLIILYISKINKRRNEKVTKMLEKALLVLSKIGKVRDAYTAEHQKRVQQLSCAIAAEMNLSKETVNNIFIGSLIHDIGKISIASELLNKPGKLTDLEFMMLQTHVMNGYDIIKEVDFPCQISDIICQHHERLDGSGYPEGLSGDQIAIESRIVAVADVVEAMSTDRPYRSALGIKAALEEIEKYKGIKYDIAVVVSCSRLFMEKQFKFINETEK